MIDLEQGQDFPLNESSVRPVRVLDKALQVSRWGMHAGVGGIGEGFSGECWVLVRRRRDDCPTVTGSVYGVGVTQGHTPPFSCMGLASECMNTPITLNGSCGWGNELEADAFLKGKC